MSKGLALVGWVAFLLPSAAAAAAEPPTRAIMPEGLHSVLSDDDYPKEAIRSEEEGTVTFRLEIGADGKPTDCAVTVSSGSAVLDATTCRIMTERPRFRPARDAKGRPTTDQVTSTVRWVLPDKEDMPPRINAAYTLWTTCVFGEAAKLVPGDESVDQVAARSFASCAALEAIVSKEIKQTLPLIEARGSVVETLLEMVPKLRADLQAADPEPRATADKPSRRR